ncbi:MULTISPECIES: PqqD family protein [unclassified Rathayibacter]|uniref:PqqD family protein n=1 Tax=unclassified Rathayibacter TaxID=2609250 RepID=UPI0014151056|nr:MULTISPECIES: PqqD family protein [unclassified Rathayibacter]
MSDAIDAEQVPPAPYLELGATIAYVDAEDRVLVLDVAKEEAISEFTDSALSIWREALAAPSFEELVAAVAAIYDVSEHLIRSDCKRFLEHLLAEGVLLHRPHENTSPAA